MNTKTMKRKQYTSPSTCILGLGDMRLLDGSLKVHIDHTKQDSQSEAEAPGYFDEEEEEEEY